MNMLFLKCRLVATIIIGLVICLLGGCAAGPKVVKVQIPVVVVVNADSTISPGIGEYYRKARNLLPEQVITINCSFNEEITKEEYLEKVEKPIRNYLIKSTLKNQVDYIVLTKGVPFRIKEDGYSVDSFLMMMFKDLKPMPNSLTEADAIRCVNPYFNKKEHFSFKTYGFYLVTRLDGYYDKDAKALVDRSLAAKPFKGRFLLDMDPNRTGKGYKEKNDSMLSANDMLINKGMSVRLDKTDEFIGGMSGLMGYYSWGSNDKHYNKTAYNSLRFLPGSISETCVSTSAHTFLKVDWWQSLIADLVTQGVTGVKGYVSEPYSIALCPADILFDRYTSGYNLAESFWMATPFLKWKDVVIGDPLCAPYGPVK
jgi:uncharacterized protein (TIGR03790 family)